ncbi:hypothetical protein COU18_03200 [Candidatus Kaiserbacteria bacterium CG10_big_fil_rev_8_21_14_0_10_51_14]|uniref:PsbP C-terminal domain-containing protein n=1 Tax=Candidatus Kaiserbacteria bacterium CG10_big_fil_rev_8_21_14_0_10_51_14 TaxID=1974610 RepID=A0A2H0UB87_9BACT|nr:MAG: hypothetical protein COU18_03200 [Candidatus Kaiserbacteria bacterium CG10_big_fil_rev_8_21_14_0_10_51_14]
MVRIITAFLVLLAVALGAYAFLFKSSISTPFADYENSEYGIRFKYPASYKVQEHEVGNSERGHYAIVLIDKEALANLPEAGEGPTVMSVDIYQNNLDQLSLENWIRGINDSNFKLSIDGKLSSTSVAGVSAYFYRWDGLYRADSYALAHKDNIVVFSATYLGEKDQIRKDFEKVMDSVVLN